MMAQISKLRMRILEWGGPQFMIAGRAGISPSRISEYCLLQKPIALHHITPLCEVLECQPEDIVGIWEQPDLQAWEKREQRNI